MTPSPVRPFPDYADDSLVVPAIIAGADGILPKSAPSLQLFETIRVIADGGTALPPLSADLLKIAGGLLDPEDVPILGMLVSRTARRDIANALQLNPDALARRIARMLNRLKAHVGPAKKPITTTR
jgi:DNA-binding NarL/FixJ family response regulator